MSVICPTGRRRTPWFESTETARAYYANHAGAIQIAAFLEFASALPLGIFTATVTSRLRFLGMNVAGVSIAMFGGVASSLFLAFSGLFEWVLSQPGIVGDAGVMRAFQLLGFATGGPAHVASLGLLAAGVSIPSAFARLIPRWLAWLGLGIAVAAELSTLSLVLPAAAVFLPMARFPAYVWMIGAGFAMPTSARSGGVSGTAPR